jgi:hypothetical protein
MYTCVMVLTSSINTSEICLNSQVRRVSAHCASVILSILKHTEAQSLCLHLRSLVNMDPEFYESTYTFPAQVNQEDCQILGVQFPWKT